MFRSQYGIHVGTLYLTLLMKLKHMRSPFLFDMDKKVTHSKRLKLMCANFQMEMLYGTPFPVTPACENGFRSSYGKIPAPFLFL